MTPVMCSHDTFDLMQHMEGHLSIWREPAEAQAEPADSTQKDLLGGNQTHTRLAARPQCSPVNQRKIVCDT